MHTNSNHREDTRSQNNKQQDKDPRAEKKTSGILQRGSVRENAMKATLRVMQDYDKTFKRLSD